MDLPIHRRGLTSSVAVSFALMASMMATSTLAQGVSQEAYEVSNAPTEMLSGAEWLRAEDARLTRFDDRIEFELTMDVPRPNGYVYPEGVPPERRAAPEAFTLWAFVFNHPEQCTSGQPPLTCGGDDFSEAVKGGVYGLAGHVPSIDHSGGAFVFDRATAGQMTLAGEIKVGDAQRSDQPPGEITFPLENPMGAEVHFAVAPHGQMVPETITAELYSPAGSPDCGCWWGAFFLPPSP